MSNVDNAIMMWRRDGGNSSSASCGFQGNSDMYGLGVRLGAYLQGLSTILAYNLLRSEISSMSSVNLCYELALLTSLIWFTVSSGSDLQAIEPFLGLLFCFGGVCVSSARAWEQNKDDQVGNLLNQALTAAVCGYSVWFLFAGMDDLRRTPACPPTAFFFAPVPLYGWYRSFLKAMFIIGLVGFTVLVILVLMKLSSGLIEWLETWAQPGSRVSTFDAATPVYILSKALFLGLSGLAIFVVAVELTIFWNQVQGVYNASSFSQIFPLVTGGSNLVRLLFKLSLSFWTGKLRFRQHHQHR